MPLDRDAGEEVIGDENITPPPCLSYFELRVVGTFRQLPTVAPEI